MSEKWCKRYITLFIIKFNIIYFHLSLVPFPKNFLVNLIYTLKKFKSLEPMTSTEKFLSFQSKDMVPPISHCINFWYITNTSIVLSRSTASHTYNSQTEIFNFALAKFLYNWIIYSTVIKLSENKWMLSWMKTGKKLKIYCGRQSPKPSKVSSMWFSIQSQTMSHWKICLLFKQLNFLIVLFK